MRCPSVCVEFELRQFTDAIQVRDMTKGKKSNGGLAPGITLLCQDHMRLVGDLFENELPETLLVADEFHLCLCQKTLRTKTMLEWSAACKQLVGMSGTPTITHQLYDLMPVLSPIAPFELTLCNFFVGYSFAINHRTCVDIETQHDTWRVDMPGSKGQYWDLLPMLGENIHGVIAEYVGWQQYWDLLPSMLCGNNNKRLEGKDLNTLIDLSQEVATQTMVETTYNRVMCEKM